MVIRMRPELGVDLASVLVEALLLGEPFGQCALAPHTLRRLLVGGPAASWWGHGHRGKATEGGCTPVLARPSVEHFWQ